MQPEKNVHFAKQYIKDKNAYAMRLRTVDTPLFDLVCRIEVVATSGVPPLDRSIN